MTTQLCAIGVMLVALAAAPWARADNVGFDVVTMPGPSWSSLRVNVWYPTDAAPAPLPLALTTQDVAFGAPLKGAGHPLIVMSHGNGGSGFSHIDTALALAHAGFIVAAATHNGDNYRDHSRETQLMDRPPQISAVIDDMLHTWPGHTAIDARRIGMFGFSAGGFTTLVAIGGVPDAGRIGPYCNAHRAAFVCTLIRRDIGEGATTLGRPAADPRIRAAVIAAPALGFSFSRDGLRDVHVPVQLWAAMDDEVLSVHDDDETVRDGLPIHPDYHAVPGAGHFDFLAPCSAELATIAPPICTEIDGFDRTAFHRMFDHAIVAFFNRALNT